MVKGVNTLGQESIYNFNGLGVLTGNDGAVSKDYVVDYTALSVHLFSVFVLGILLISKKVRAYFDEVTNIKGTKDVKNTRKQRKHR